MKLLLTISLLITSFYCFSSEDKGARQKKVNIEQRKEKIIARIDERIKKTEERISKMKEAKSCIEQATDKSAIKACRSKIKNRK